VALVSYTLLIMFRNTLTGLREVPAEVRDAAAGMGMSPMRTLLRVDLPLALPAIIAGLRIATVTVISLATVAALIDDEGLGAPILQAISNEVFKTELIVAGGMAIALALLADGLLVLLQRALTPWARVRV
jgi:osmoprotectant transport system permease protein